MPDLPAILNAIRLHPEDERHWAALASWLWDNGRDAGNEQQRPADPSAGRLEYRRGYSTLHC